MRRGRRNSAVRFGERLLGIGVWRVSGYIQAAQLRPVAFGVVLCWIDAQLAHDVIAREISQLPRFYIAFGKNFVDELIVVQAFFD